MSTDIRFVSVIIPAFNGRARLRENLPAVKTAAAKLTVPNEIIVVDDGGTDGTAEWGAQARLRESEGQLRVASRLAAMGTLVAGVTHEMNNPLAGVIAGQTMALEDLDSLRVRAFRGEGISAVSIQSDTVSPESLFMAVSGCLGMGPPHG